MRKYGIKETKEIETIVCNKCGKEIRVKSGIPSEDILQVEKRWGYFSDKDNEEHTFDLCEACYDELVAGFQIPVDVEER